MKRLEADGFVGKPQRNTRKGKFHLRGGKIRLKLYILGRSVLHSEQSEKMLADIKSSKGTHSSNAMQAIYFMYSV